MHRLHRLRVDVHSLGPLRGIKLPPRSVVMFGLILALTIGVVLAIPLSRASLIAPNQPSPVTLQSPATTTFDSDVRTRQAQERVANEVQPVYSVEADVLARQREALVEALGLIGSIRDNASLDQDDQMSALTGMQAPPITTTLEIGRASCRERV